MGSFDYGFRFGVFLKVLNLYYFLCPDGNLGAHSDVHTDGDDPNIFNQAVLSLMFVSWLFREGHELEYGKWKRISENITRKNMHIPPPPLTPQQREVPRKILEYLDKLMEWENSDRKELRPENPFFLLYGGGGTGKSTIIKMLNEQII